MPNQDTIDRCESEKAKIVALLANLPAQHPARPSLEAKLVQLDKQLSRLQQ